LRVEACWNEVQQRLVASGIWRAQHGFDGRRYDSRAEAIVANYLQFTGINYIPHPLLPWRGKGRRRQAGDLLLDEKQLYVEVFMCSAEGLKRRKDQQADWVVDYLKKRDAKIQRYLEHGLPLIIIEAELYREHGLPKYIEHIRKTFQAVGIDLPLLGNIKIELGGDTLGLKWSLEEFVDYAKSNNIISLSGFIETKHSHIYKVLTHRCLRDDVRRELDILHGRKTEAEGKFLAKKETIREACQNLGIVKREQYESAFSNNLLPEGAPMSVYQSYHIKWTEFIHGRARDDFWSYTKARDYLRPLRLKSRSEFEYRVRNDKDLRFIRRCPSNRHSGGYDDFISWFDFLGKEK